MANVVIILGLGGLGLVILFFLLQRTLAAPKSRETLVYPNGRKIWVERNKQGQIKNIINISHSMSIDRLKNNQGRVKSGWDRPRKK